jgi:hypothetical protein
VLPGRRQAIDNRPMVGRPMTRRAWWLRYLVGCVLMITLCAWWYVRAVLSLPDLEGYETDWTFQLLMFAVVRLPLLVVGLAITGLVWDRLRRAR